MAVPRRPRTPVHEDWCNPPGSRPRRGPADTTTEVAARGRVPVDQGARRVGRQVLPRHRRTARPRARHRGSRSRDSGSSSRRVRLVALADPLIAPLDCRVVVGRQGRRRKLRREDPHVGRRTTGVLLRRRPGRAQGDLRGEVSRRTRRGGAGHGGRPSRTPRTRCCSRWRAWTSRGSSGSADAPDVRLSRVEPREVPRTAAAPLLHCPPNPASCRHGCNGRGVRGANARSATRKGRGRGGGRGGGASAARLNRMHGEYKVPGGKLVVVDLESRDGRIADFHLAGDFFLEPDDALDDIDAAVNGPARRGRTSPRSPPPCGRRSRGGAAAGLHARGGRHRGAPRARDRAPAGATSTGRSCTTRRSRRA